MRSRSFSLAMAVAGLLTTSAFAQVSLRDIPQLARDRAERLRPIQIAALEPYWKDLRLDYRGNQRYLDERFDKVAALGDGVVPILLEKLRPAQASTKALILATNCRRVLERLDPSSFVDALAEMARSRHSVARTEAIQLLGRANVPQSGRVLAELLDQVTGIDQQLTLRSLRLLRNPAGAKKAVALLGSQDRRLRDEVLAYLVAAEATEVVDAVVAAVRTEIDDRLLPSYIDYFAAAAEQHLAATEALLPLLSQERLDWQDRRSLVKALASVAPKGHDATIRRLHELIDGNDTSALAVQAAVSLRTLGDKQGVTRLKRTLDDKLRKRRRGASLYEQRASLLFAIGDFGDAIDDYEKILDYTEGAAMTRRAYIGLLQCEARRKKTQNLLKYMKASAMSPLEFKILADQDEPFREAIKNDRVRTFLIQLERSRAPK